MQLIDECENGNVTSENYTPETSWCRRETGEKEKRMFAGGTLPIDPPRAYYAISAIGYPVGASAEEREPKVS